MKAIDFGWRRLASSHFLRIRGEDRNDFLQRQTTNDIDALAVGQIQQTVLTNAAARILDILTIWRPDEDSLLALPLSDRGQRSFDYLRKRIFFMDKVTLTDESSDWASVEVFGSACDDWLESNDLHPQSGQQVNWSLDGMDGWIWPMGLASDRFRILIPSAQLEPLSSWLSQQCAESPEVEYEQWRVAAGYPGPAGEMTDAYTPYEIGMAHTVSETKGCYTGQEVLARQVTYDKITRSLVRLEMDAVMAPGAAIKAAGRPVGQLTSSAAPQGSAALGLAVIKRPADQAGTALEIVMDDQTVSARVAPD
jgi:folate-binding protein YgfZ